MAELHVVGREGRMVQEADLSRTPSRCTVERVLKQLDEARNRLAVWRGADLPVEAAEDIARAHTLLDRVTFQLPDVTGYAVGYHWGRADERGRRAWSTFTAHTTAEEAEAFRKAWEIKAGARRDDWTVQLMPVAIAKFVKPGTDAAAYVKASGAFT